MRITLYALAALISITFASLGHAQKLKLSPEDSIKISEAAAKADTGRMIPGYRDLTRYDTPGYCLAALDGKEQATWRNGESDTIREGESHDTLPTAALAVARACAERMTVDAVHPRELYNLMILAVSIGDSAKFNSVVERQLSLAKTDKERGYVLYDALTELLDARPIQRETALALLSRLDQFGSEARVPRMEAHRRVHRDAYNILFDTSLTMREALIIEEIEQSLLPEEREEHRNMLGGIYSDSINLLWYRQVPNLTEVSARLMEKRIGSTPEWKLTPVQREAYVGRMMLLASVVGQPAFPLDGIAKFPDTISTIPQPGKVTLLMGTSKKSGLVTSHWAMLLRLYEKYKDQGFEIVLVLGTEGYSWSSPPQSPDEEAKTIGWYFRDYLNFPFTVVVQETPFTKRPDGRKVRGIIPFAEQYPTTQILVGRDGRVHTLYVGMNSEKTLEAFIEQALVQPTSSNSNSQ